MDTDLVQSTRTYIVSFQHHWKLLMGFIYIHERVTFSYLIYYNKKEEKQINFVQSRVKFNFQKV